MEVVDAAAAAAAAAAVAVLSPGVVSPNPILVTAIGFCCCLSADDDDGFGSFKAGIARRSRREEMT